MARQRKPPEPEPVPPTGFVASATRLPPVSQRSAGKAQGWQTEAWIAFDTVAEMRFVATWVGNVMSRARLVAARKEGSDIIPLYDGPAAEVMHSYWGGEQGQSQMLQATGLNLGVAGECYHVTHDDGEWSVLASGRVTQQGNGPGAKVYADWGDGKKLLTGDDLAIRVWTPHPLDPYQADSPVRSNLGTLNEIRTLNEHVQAQLTSRLTGAGILMLPSEIQFPNSPNADPASTQADQFMAVLAEAMTTPIKDRSNASAVVPIVVTAPGDTLDKVQHLTFWTELDEISIEMRKAAVHKLALGLDTPPEVLLGVSDSNHWSGWLADESAIKSHLEPRLAVVAHALTTAYLRPALEDVVPDPSAYYVVADTSPIRLRPNRGREAIDLYDRGALSAEAMRRETGFHEEDAPSDEELKAWLWKQIATGSTTPEQTQAALRLLGADLGTMGEGESTTIGDDRRPRSIQRPQIGVPPNQQEQEREQAEPARNRVG